MRRSGFALARHVTMVLLTASSIAWAQAPQPAPAPQLPTFQPGTAPEVPDDLLADIRRHGVLRVGVGSFVPWTMRNKAGDLIGFEVDVARKLAEDLGVRLELVPTPHAEALPDLLTNRYDITLNRMSITPARALIAAFSHPLVVSEIEVVANRAKVGTRKTLAAFNTSDVTIGVQPGSSLEELARRFFPNAKLETFDDDLARLDALRDGKITTTLTLMPVRGTIARHYDKELVTPLAEPLTRRAQAFAVRPADVSFLRYLDSWIEYHTLDGWITDRVNYWFRDLTWADQM